MKHVAKSELYQCFRTAFLVISFLSLVGGSTTVHATGWMDSWPLAQQKMRTEAKPGIIYFFNVATRDCKRMDDETFAAPGVQAALNDFVAYRIDPKLNMNLAKQYEVFKVPTVIFVDPTGTPMDQAIGFKSPELFASYLERALNIYKSRGATGKPGTAAGMAATQAVGNRLPQGVFSATQPRPGTLPHTFTTTASWQLPPALIGDFNDWRQDRVIPMEKVGDKWTVTLHLPPGIYDYKLFVNGEYYQDGENPNSKPNVYGTNNSVAIVGDPSGINPKVQPNPQQPNLYDITWGFYDEDASSVALAGPFSNWEQITMFKNPAYRGEWGIRYSLPPGSYQYKLIIDGEWQNDPYNFLIETESGNRNNYFKVP